MNRPMLAYVVGLLLAAASPLPLLAQCDAPPSWFPHARTPEPDFHEPASKCEFHQWGWQTFLWLTQPTDPGRIQLLDLPRADDLFLAGKAPVTLNSAARTRMKKQPLILTPRVIKREVATGLGDINQAGSRGILVDQRGNPVYYASHVSPAFYQFVRTNEYFLKAKYVAAAPGTNFPVKSLELKSSWRVVEGGDSAAGFFTTTAQIHPLKCRTGEASCKGDDVVVDRTTVKTVTVALVGLHVVGVVEKHPEFIWSTFEHKDNAPDLPAGVPADSPNPVSGRGWTFYAAKTPAKECNVNNAAAVTLDMKTNSLSPVTNVFRQFEFGGGDAMDRGNIVAVNASVHSQLEAKSVWKNYLLVGGVWFGEKNGLSPGLAGNAIQRKVVGSVRVSNATMETFTQASKKNCFACHNTAADADAGVPAMNMNVSHILKNGLLQRAEAARAAASVVRKATGPVTSFSQVQALFDEYVKANNVPIQFAPHGAFWNWKSAKVPMTYKEFIEGDIPGVVDPGTNKPLKTLVVKDSKRSNLIMALRGTKGTIFDPETGSLGRMPPTSRPMNDADIDRIAKWIGNGCPNKP